MIRSATLEKRLAGYQETLATWAEKEHGAVLKGNVDVQLFRTEEGAMRLLAGAIFVAGKAEHWIAYEAAEERQAEPDVAICRELLPEGGMRVNVLAADACEGPFDLSDAESRYDLFTFLRELIE